MMSVTSTTISVAPIADSPIQSRVDVEAQPLPPEATSHANPKRHTGEAHDTDTDVLKPSLSPEPLAAAPLFPRVLWLVCTILSVLLGIYALQYLGLELFVPPNIAANRFKTGWLVVHAGAASLTLFLGPAQFVAKWRRQRPKLHRWMGRAYAFACCTAGGAALVLAVGVSTGPISAVGFFLLGSCWIGTTVMGVVQARRGLLPSHRRWMIRSFALALSAVTLRAYIPIGIKITGGQFDPAYRGIAWACWVPNLIAAEFYIRMVPPTGAKR